MTMANYPSGFKDGVSIRGVPLSLTHPGKVFWVSNATTLLYNQRNGSDSNAGTYNDPYATLTQALSMCIANRGDIIFVKPGHAETISAAAGLALNKAGVAIIGLGRGSMRPTITLGTANTATVDVSAANVTISNFLFKANFLNIATCFNIANASVATDLVIDNCEFRDNSVILNFVTIVNVGTGANSADGLTLSNNKVFAAILTTVPAGQTFLTLGSAIDRLNVSGNTVVYPKDLADTATLIAGGANNMTNAVIDGNYTFRPATSTTGGHMISSSSTACSGFVSNNVCAHLDATGGLLIATGTKFSFFRNFCMITGAADKSALENPAAV
jgi:hypothetical protein